MIGYATEQLAIIDNAFKSKLKGINEVIQWKIGDDIAYYTEIKNESIKNVDGTASNPTITFEIDNVSEALNLLTGRTDISDLVNKIKVTGEASKVQQLAFLTETVREYMEGITGGG
ncbi:MAG: SCP2 sterol-binding domain-containing protein [Promethearchaeota archaeon]